MENLDKHYKPQNKSDRVALAFTKFLRFKILDNSRKEITFEIIIVTCERNYYF